jgi:hypothetical protein
MLEEEAQITKEEFMAKFVDENGVPKYVELQSAAGVN